jgi:hypothetical protein
MQNRGQKIPFILAHPFSISWSGEISKFDHPLFHHLLNQRQVVAKVAVNQNQERN